MIKLVDVSEIKADKAGEIKEEKTENIESKSIEQKEIKKDESKIEQKEIKKDESKIEQKIGERSIRCIKLKQDVYYGPRNSNKNKFVRLYKKINLVWSEGVKIGDILVDGWFNKDKSQYIIKLVEEGGYKRFKFYGCDDIYAYFVSLGGITFELTDKDKVASSSKGEDDDEYHFVGADLWAHHRTEQLLKKMPPNWGVIWK